MALASSRRLIGASVDRVFSLATQPERLPDWDPLFASVSGVQGPLDRVGAAFDAEMRIAGRRLRMRHTVTQVQPGRALTIVGVGREGGRLTWTDQYTIAGTFGTQLERHLEYELPEGFADDFGERPSYRRDIENDLIRALDNLAVLAESKPLAV